VPIALSGCDKSDAAESGARRGATLIGKYGCGGCHTIPGIAQANGVVGPPLTMMGRRTYIAGMLRNTSDNMAAWVRAPQSIVPGNVMPNMSIGGRDAQDIAAYLESLR
jgi:cytochrome c1